MFGGVGFTGDVSWMPWIEPPPSLLRLVLVARACLASAIIFTPSSSRPMRSAIRRSRSESFGTVAVGFLAVGRPMFWSPLSSAPAALRRHGRFVKLAAGLGLPFALVAATLGFAYFRR